MKSGRKIAIAAGLAMGFASVGTSGAQAGGAEFTDLPPVTFPDVDPCTGDNVFVTLDSEMQVVDHGDHRVVIFRSTSSATDGSTARGIETRKFNGDRYDINLRFMASNPDGHRYQIVANLSGEGEPQFSPPTLTCIRPPR